MSELTTTETAALSLDLTGVKDHYKLFNQFKSDICKKDIDYGKIPGTDKPTLYQPGAQKLAKAFHLNTRLEKTEYSADVQTGFVMYEYRCTVYNAAGDVIGQGVGSCNSFEDKYCFSGWKAEQEKPTESVKAQMQADGTGTFRKDFQTKAWVWNTRTKKRAQELIAMQNTIMKMAAKRAFVHAVLNSTGGGEFFTQDIEDMPEIIEAGQKAAELESFVFWALKNLAVGANDVKDIWAQCPALQKDAGFIEAVKARYKDFTDDQQS